MEKLDRKDLKHDAFVEEVQHTVEYAGQHKKQIVQYGSIALAVLVIGGLIYWYMGAQTSQRQVALKEALSSYESAVGAQSTPFMKVYATKEEREKAIRTDLGKVISAYPGSDEAAICKYYIAVYNADEGKLGDAEKLWKEVSAEGNKNYRALAKYSLAQLYAAQNKTGEAEKLLRELADSPTPVLSKEQAQIMLARVIKDTKPDEARKLLDPLKTSRAAVSRVALGLLGEMQKK